MTHCFLLECCTKTHIDDYLRFVICIFFLFFVLISAFPLYFVAFCQRLIYEYMDGYGVYHPQLKLTFEAEQIIPTISLISEQFVSSTFIVRKCSNRLEVKCYSLFQHFPQFIHECRSERIIKICPSLPKLS